MKFVDRVLLRAIAANLVPKLSLGTRILEALLREVPRIVTILVALRSGASGIRGAKAGALARDRKTILLRALSFWKARQGLEESTSESELVVTGFACKGGTANGLWT